MFIFFSFNSLSSLLTLISSLFSETGLFPYIHLANVVLQTCDIEQPYLLSCGHLFYQTDQEKIENCQSENVERRNAMNSRTSTVVINFDSEDIVLQLLIYEYTFCCTAYFFYKQHVYKRVSI